jgi:hypothetical protein
MEDFSFEQICSPAMCALDKLTNLTALNLRNQTYFAVRSLVTLSNFQVFLLLELTDAIDSVLNCFSTPLIRLPSALSIVMTLDDCCSILATHPERLDAGENVWHGEFEPP